MILYKFTANNSGILIDYIRMQLTDLSRNKIKQFFKYRQIQVNNQSGVKHNYKLKKNDVIIILKENRTSSIFHKMRILSENDGFISIEKDPGLLSVKTNFGNERTVFSQLSEYYYKKNKNNKIFVVHRIDRDISGVLIFAKSLELKEKIQKNWNTLVRERKYIALAEGSFLKKQGKIESYLTESKSLHVYPDKKEGKLAITCFNVLHQNKDYTLLEIHLETGRKNQIRVHLQQVGHPIVGDVKYGAMSNPYNRIMLHAVQLKILHPDTMKEMNFISEPAVFFKKPFF